MKTRCSIETSNLSLLYFRFKMVEVLNIEEWINVAFFDQLMSPRPLAVGSKDFLGR